MALTISELQVKVLADPRPAQTGLGKINASFGLTETAAEHAATKSDSFFSKLTKGLGQAASFAAGGIIVKGIDAIAGGISDFVTQSIGESKGWNAAMAQTEAVVKSTGGAAGFTAKQLGDLAASLSGANGVSMASDDTVLAAENMLLTFTNIGKNVFPGATQTALDMAQALGGDAASQSVALGKALNDPIAGVGALSRVGVTFTDVQKKMIKTMMQAGDIEGAQKVILGELGKEFGGSAAAAAKADGGMFQLSESFANVQQTVGDALLPIIHQLVGFLASPQVMGTIQGLADLVAGALTGGFEFLKGVLDKVGPPVKFVADRIGELVKVAWDMITTGESVGEEWQTFSPLMEGIAGTIADVIATVQQFAGVLTQAFGGGLKLDAIQALPGFLQPIATLYGTVAENVGEFIRALQGGTDPLTAFGALIKNNLVDLLTNLGLKQSDVTGFLDGMGTAAANAQTAIGDFVTNAITFFGQVGAFVASPGVQGVLNTVATLISTQLTNAVTTLSNAWAVAGPAIGTALANIGTALKPVADAVGILIGVFGKSGFAGVVDLVTGKLASANPVIQTMQGIWQAVQPVLQAISNIWNNLAPVFQRIGEQIMPKLTAAWVALQPGLQAVGDIIQKWVIPAIEVLGGIVATIIGAGVITTFSLLVGVFDGIVAALPGLGQAFSGVFETVDGVINTFWALISGIWTLLSDLFTGNFDEMGAHLKQTWDGLSQGITQIVQGLSDTIGGILNALVGFLGGLFSGFWETITGIWRGISDALIGHSIITDMVAGIQGAIQGLVDTVTGFFTGLWNGLVSLARDFVVNLLVHVLAFKDQVVAKVTELKDLAFNIISTLWTNITNAARDFVVGVMVHVLKFKNDAIAKITELKDLALNLVTTLWTNITTAARDFVVNVAVHILKFKDDAIAAFTGLKDKAIEAITTLWTNLVQAASDFVVNVAVHILKFRDDAIAAFVGLKDKAIEAITGVGGLIAGIVGAFAGLLQSGTDAAGNIIQGLVNGLTTGKDQVINFIKGIAQGAIDAVKTTLGIQSPSTVMYDSGTMLMQGLADGLTATQHLVKELLDLLASAVRFWGDSLAGLIAPGLAAMAAAVRDQTVLGDAKTIAGAWDALLTKLEVRMGGIPGVPGNGASFWPNLREAWVSLFATGIPEAISSNTPVIVKMFQDFTGDLLTAATTMKSKIVEAVQGTASAWNTSINGMKGPIDSLASTVTSDAGTIASAMDGVLKTVTDDVADILAAIASLPKTYPVPVPVGPPIGGAAAPLGGLSMLGGGIARPAYGAHAAVGGPVYHIAINGLAFPNAPPAVGAWLVAVAQRKAVRNRGRDFNGR